MLQQKESYDVLRLIEHGQLCYISSENVQGKTLDRYLKYHPVIKKREIFLLLKEIAGQLASFHRCRGNPCYQYVNPYSIVRSEDGRIYFLDMQSEANRSKMIFMQRRDIREYFLPPDEKYYQHASKELDMYGLGKTFQYILASVEAEPRFNRRDMASDTCIQGIKELGESEELKLTHIRLICADPAVNRDTCALKIKEYVTEDTELLENAEFKKLQKEYGIKAEGGNIWVGR